MAPDGPYHQLDNASMDGDDPMQQSVFISDRLVEFWCPVVSSLAHFHVILPRRRPGLPPQHIRRAASRLLVQLAFPRHSVNTLCLVLSWLPRSHSSIGLNLVEKGKLLLLLAMNSTWGVAPKEPLAKTAILDDGSAPDPSCCAYIRPNLSL